MLFNKNITFNLKYENLNLLQVEEFKLLGITLDPQFLFKKQSTTIANKINLTNSILNKNFNLAKIPYKIKKMIFNSLICSHIHYFSIYFPCLSIGSQTSLIKKFNFIVKKFFGTNNKERELNTIISNDIYTFMNKLLNNKHPKPIFNVLSKYLSFRKQNYFILYKKPRKQLTFLFNLMSINNQNHSRKINS